MRKITTRAGLGRAAGEPDRRRYLDRDRPSLRRPLAGFNMTPLESTDPL